MALTTGPVVGLCELGEKETQIFCNILDYTNNLSPQVCISRQFWWANFIMSEKKSHTDQKEWCFYQVSLLKPTFPLGP